MDLFDNQADTINVTEINPEIKLLQEINLMLGETIKLTQRLQQILASKGATK